MELRQEVPKEMRHSLKETLMPSQCRAKKAHAHKHEEKAKSKSLVSITSQWSGEQGGGVQGRGGLKAWLTWLESCPFSKLERVDKDKDKSPSRGLVFLEPGCDLPWQLV